MVRGSSLGLSLETIAQTGLEDLVGGGVHGFSGLCCYTHIELTKRPDTKIRLPPLHGFDVRVLISWL